jgi:hypothetical protein
MVDISKFKPKTVYVSYIASTPLGLAGDPLQP